jgi:hypothetical protein
MPTKPATITRGTRMSHTITVSARVTPAVPIQPAGNSFAAATRKIVGQPM